MVQWCEQLIPFREIPGIYRRLAKISKNPSHSAVRRWYRDGVKGSIRLEVRYIGGEVHTTESALRLFIALRNEACHQRRKKRKPQPPAGIRQYSIEASLARLDAMGV